MFITVSHLCLPTHLSTMNFLSTLGSLPKPKWRGSTRLKWKQKQRQERGTNRNLVNSKSVEIKDGNTPKCMQSMVVDATALAAEIEQHSLPTGKERTNTSQSTISASNTEKSSINTVATVPVNNKPARRPT